MEIGRNPFVDFPQTHSILAYFGTMNALIFFTYSILTLYLLIQHRKNLGDSFAYKNRTLTLNWLFFLPALFFLYVLFLVIWENSAGLSAVIHPSILQSAGFLLLILYLSFFGMKQKRIFQPEVENAEIHTPGIQPPDDILSSQLIEKMNELMLREKPYVEARFSVYELAASLNISRHHLSSLINSKLSKNFFQYVNEYRLNEVISLMKEDLVGQFNIMEIAYNAGFNSKSSFNSLFKQKFGMTPTQYRKNLKK
jgi:AraC-like DNA-binding protein